MCVSGDNKSQRKGNHIIGFGKPKIVLVANRMKEGEGATTSCHGTIKGARVVAVAHGVKAAVRAVARGAKAVVNPLRMWMR